MRLPEPHAQLAKDTLKDPYIFDFLTLDKPFRERELETGLVEHLERSFPLVFKRKKRDAQMIDKQ